MSEDSAIVIVYFDFIIFGWVYTKIRRVQKLIVWNATWLANYWQVPGKPSLKYLPTRQSSIDDRTNAKKAKLLWWMGNNLAPDQLRK